MTIANKEDFKRQKEGSQWKGSEKGGYKLFLRHLNGVKALYWMITGEKIRSVDWTTIEQVWLHSVNKQNQNLNGLTKADYSGSNYIPVWAQKSNITTLNLKVGGSTILPFPQEAKIWKYLISSTSVYYRVKMGGAWIAKKRNVCSFGKYLY